jgi:hypothetical protein
MVVVVASIIGMFAVAVHPQQASAAVDRCAYQQFQHSGAFVNCTQNDTPFILPFP